MWRELVGRKNQHKEELSRDSIELSSEPVNSYQDAHQFQQCYTQQLVSTLTKPHAQSERDFQLQD